MLAEVPMTNDQKELIRKTFCAVEPNATQVAALFYQELFTLDPSLRGMFKSNIEEQGRKLMQALKFVVSSLDKPDALNSVLRDMGQRHVNYGVRSEHYRTVGSALLNTLHKGLGQAFTAEVREAWTAAYSVIADTMKLAESASLQNDKSADDMR